MPKDLSNCKQTEYNEFADFDLDNIELVMSLLQENASLAAQANPECNTITAEDFRIILARIAQANTEQELGNIRHESPTWGFMNNAMSSAFNTAIEVRRVFLNEVKYISSDDMSIYDRARFIAHYASSTDPDKQELVKIARQVQERMSLNMSAEEIERKPDLLTAYKTKYRKPDLAVYNTAERKKI